MQIEYDQVMMAYTAMLLWFQCEKEMMDFSLICNKTMKWAPVNILHSSNAGMQNDLHVVWSKYWSKASQLRISIDDHFVKWLVETLLSMIISCFDTWMQVNMLDHDFIQNTGTQNLLNL